MSRHAPPTRTLREHPDLDQLKRQAKELLESFRAGNPAAVQEIHTHYRQADRATFALHDAQLVLARAHGFDSWPKLKAFVDGVTVRRLADASARGDLDLVSSMVAARPELVHLDIAENDEHRALHQAVLQRQPEIVRFLMRHGADARKGIWPHRDATSAFTLASERGYTDIVAIIREEEEEEEERRSGDATPPTNANAEMLLARGASRTARSAIATGDDAWVRARQADGTLATYVGLLTQAITANRPVTLTLLLDLGLDPDAAGRVEGIEDVVPTWGDPLRECALQGKLEMAEILLAHGANPNTNVYAASSAIYVAHERKDEAMIALLERHGGHVTPVFAGILGLVDQAATFLATYAQGPASDAPTSPGSSIGELLWGAIESPSPEIVRMTLPHIDWPREDARWHWILENGLYLRPESDRPRYLEAFRLVLDRCDPNVRSKRGCTLLHDIAASRGKLTASDRIAYATLLLDKGARLDLRDDLLLSTPLGWACRWGRVELVKLLLERGADPVESAGEPWTTPKAWAHKRSDLKMLALLDSYFPVKK